MLRPFFLYASLLVFFSACDNNKTTEQPMPEADTTGKQAQTADLPQLPSYVVFKNWEIGDSKKSELVHNVYQAWDSENPGDMATYFADSTVYDFPDGTRVVTTKATVDSTLRKWRKNYKETSNIPISLMSLHNNDLNQDWVIAWTWNKWRDTGGKRDSMLYCDNWQIKEGKIIYLNSLQNRASKSLSVSLNKLSSR